MLCHEHETDEQQQDSHERHIRLPVASLDDGTAGLVVMFYLLFISTVFIGTILGAFFIVIQYGFVVFVAVVVAVFGLCIVAAVVTSAVAQEKTLMEAKTKINRCVC